MRVGLSSAQSTFSPCLWPGSLPKAGEAKMRPDQQGAVCETCSVCLYRRIRENLKPAVSSPRPAHSSHLVMRVQPRLTWHCRTGCPAGSEPRPKSPRNEERNHSFTHAVPFLAGSSQVVAAARAPSWAPLGTGGGWVEPRSCSFPKGRWWGVRVARWTGLGRTLCFRQCRVVFLLEVVSSRGSEGFLKARALVSFFITDSSSFKEVPVQGPVNPVGMLRARVHR